MKKTVLNKKFLLFALGAFLVSLFFIIPHFAGAQASIITDAAVGIFVMAFKVFAYIFNTILGFLFMLAGGLVNIAMGLNAQILGKTNTLVSIGWTITRDVANLGFVLIMIVMAVATIVRYEKYSVQKLLPLLIGAAILVNFSLTIAGVFISFSNTISDAFSARLVGEGATNRNFTDAIAGAFSPQRLLIKNTDNPEPPDPASQGNFLSGVSAAALISISGLVFNVIFLAIAVLSMAALALMLIYRYIYLSFLLILSPLAWMFWVFPDLKYLYDKWWTNFIKWCFFLPAVTFFLYLAVETAFQMEKNSIFINVTGFTGALASIMAQGAQMIVLAGLLLGGLIVAQELGIKGASGAMSLATKAKDGALGAIGSYGKNRATNIGRRVLTGGVDKEGKTRLERWGASAAGKIPLVGAAITGLSGASTRAKTRNKKDVEEAQKRTEGRSGEEAANILNRQMTGGAMMSDADLAAWGMKAAEKGKLKDVDPKTQEQIVAAVKRTDSADKFLGYAPQFYDKFGVDPGKAVGKYVQDASKLDEPALRYRDPVTQQYDNNIAINLRNSHVVQLANSGNDAQRQVVADAIKDVLGGNLAGVEQAITQLNTAKFSGNAQGVQNAKGVISQINANLTDDQKKAMSVYQNIQSNVNWASVNW